MSSRPCLFQPLRLSPNSGPFTGTLNCVRSRLSLSPQPHPSQSPSPSLALGQSPQSLPPPAMRLTTSVVDFSPSAARSSSLPPPTFHVTSVPSTLPSAPAWSSATPLASLSPLARSPAPPPTPPWRTSSSEEFFDSLVHPAPSLLDLQNQDR
ncbi:hypothetical protein [Olive latent virus 3]|uniref:Uncharacterized protein p16 n=1 Tax=Olive latent virus 3 TaxID=626962 RepID=C5HGJ4_9VIRU|nr:hypothetical protein [Olive latent virus 3]ACN94864.1 hypothetical protein [Olive latent virus 3]